MATAGSILASGPSYSGPYDLGTPDAPSPLLAECATVNELRVVRSTLPLQAFDSVEEIGYLVMEDLTEDRMGGLDSLRSVGVAELRSVVALEEATFFRSLESLGAVSIYGALPLDIPGVEEIGAIGIADSTILSINAPRLRAVRQNLRLRFSDFSGAQMFPQLAAVGGEMILEGLTIDQLGFESLTSIGGNLEATALTLPSWNGLSALESVGANLEVVGNSWLPPNEPRQWGEGVQVIGTTHICGNGSALLVEDPCD